MRIKKNKNFFNFKNSLNLRYLLIFFFVFTSLFFLYLGAWLYKEKKHIYVKDTFFNLSSTISNYIDSFTVSPKIVYLDINQKNFLELSRQRKQALETGIGDHDDNKYVKMDLTYEDLKYKSKVRLKGTLKDHWDTDKWSLNIKMSDNKFEGMKRFSLMHPKTRGYLHGYIDLKIFQEEGLLVARQDFINLIINGEDKGVYLLEEKPRKELLESQSRREGPILFFDKKDLVKEWINYGSDPLNNFDLSRGASSFYASELKIFYNLNDEIGKEIKKKSFLLLDKFRRGEISPSKIFDLDLLGKYLALKVIIGASELDPNDIFFYFDPVRSIFEPIAIDLHGNEGIGDWWKAKLNFSDRRDIFTHELLKDVDVQKSFIKNLKIYSQKNVIKNKIDKIIRENIDPIKTLLSEYPQYDLNIDRYKSNIAYINSILNPSRYIEIRKEIFSNSIVYKIGNLQELPIFLKDYKDSNKTIKLDKIIPGNSFNRKIEFSEILDGIDVENGGIITYSILGLEEESLEYSLEAAVNLDISDEFLGNLTKINTNHECISSKTKETLIFNESCNISKTVLIDSSVSFRECTQINLSNHASIVFRGAIFDISSKKNCQIKIIGDGTGGVVFIDSPKVILKNVFFEGLSIPKISGTFYTGGLTVINSRIEIFDSKVLNSLSEDGLNLIRTEYNLNNFYIENSSSDAIDIDFGRGKLSNININNSANDGLDISGSKVQINNLKVFNSGDKGFSIGEKSSVEAKNIKIENSLIGVACKDSSIAELRELIISKTKFPIASFRKKSEYNGGFTKIYTGSNDNEAFTKNYLLDKFSKIQINDQRLIPNSDNKKLNEFLYD